MPKYVCDFAQVTAAGDKLVEAASEMTTATNQYASNIKSDLSGWNGQAKASFINQCDTLVGKTTQKAEYIESFGEFIKGASKSIQELDEQLASLSI